MYVYILMSAWSVDVQPARNACGRIGRKAVLKGQTALTATAVRPRVYEHGGVMGGGQPALRRHAAKA